MNRRVKLYSSFYNIKQQLKWVKVINAGSGNLLPPQDIRDKGNSCVNVIDITQEP